MPFPLKKFDDIFLKSSKCLKLKFLQGNNAAKAVNS